MKILSVDKNIQRTDKIIKVTNKTMDDTGENTNDTNFNNDASDEKTKSASKITKIIIPVPTPNISTIEGQNISHGNNLQDNSNTSGFSPVGWGKKTVCLRLLL